MVNSETRQPGAGAAAVELLEDWITIWHSEMAALVLDRESQDAMLRLLELWASQTRASLVFMASAFEAGAAGEPARRPAGTDASPGTATADAAPDGRDALIERLSGRLSELERRLARLDSAPH